MRKVEGGMDGGQVSKVESFLKVVGGCGCEGGIGRSRSQDTRGRGREEEFDRNSI